MSDPTKAIQFLLQNLQKLVTYKWKLISGAGPEVEMLQNDLRLFKKFLKDTAKMRRTKNSFSELVRQVCDVVYKAEDAIENFETHAAESKSKKWFTISTLHGIAVEVRRVRSEVEKIYGGKSKLVLAAEMSGGDNEHELVEAPWVREENIVGFEDEEEKLKSCIGEQTQKLDVISITGGPGHGKTTLAWKIYRDPKIEFDFPTRIWADVSQKYTNGDVFHSILGQLGSSNDDEKYLTMTNRALAQVIKNRLEREKFFMVLDGVRKTTDWDKLQITLPWNNNTGKILLTSQNNEVANYANPIRMPLVLRFLTHGESWLLLKYLVFGTHQCPNDKLEELGKSIAKECNGLPAAVVNIGRILAKKCYLHENMNVKINRWTKVSNSVNGYLREDPEKSMEKFITPSYDAIPYQLKDCLQFFSLYPDVFEIPAWNLSQMWIAEGLIEKVDNMSLENTAENYLESLINMNLVRIDKTTRNGKVKTCRILKIFCDFLKDEAGRENFMQELKFSDGCLEPSVDNIKTYRRISMHSNVRDLVSAKPFGPRVRSFVSCSREETILPKASSSAILAAFKRLRVLEANPLKFKKIPKEMYSLVQLRYINLSFDNLKVLPRPFSELRKIQTLILNTTSRTLKIEADIWKMMDLTHLKINAITTLPKPGKTIRGGAKLRTLGAISPKSCTVEVFTRGRNLKELCIQGKLTTLLHGQIDSLGRLEILEKLKLINDVFPIPPSEAPIRSLPPPNKFPPQLKSLTLSATYLDWVHMSVLGMLENLAELKLKNNAFMGEKWVTTDGGFWNLEILVIGSTDLVIWEASAHHFPRLRCLELRNCEYIQAIPVEFAEIPSLQSLDLYHASLAANSAKKIRDAKENSGFKLIVYPPVE